MSDIEKVQIAMFSKSSEDPFVHSEAERKLVKKINCVFIPFVCFIIFIQFVDKSTLTTISVIEEFFTDTGISKDQFAWLGSIFYLGFFCMQAPNNYMLQKFAISKYFGSCLVIWGMVLFCMARGRKFCQFAVLRFLLGFFEAVTYPTILILIATIYRRSEQVIWLGVMYISTGVGGVIGTLAGVCIIKMSTVGVIAPWKWGFLIFGSITILIGLIYFFFLPDTPKSKCFRLTKEEQIIVEERTRDNTVVPTQKINYDQIKEALKEPRFYCYCLISCLTSLQDGAFTLFTGIIISGLGFSDINAILLTVPIHVVTIIFIFTAINISKVKKEIIFVAIGTCSISLTGLLCLTIIPSGGVKLIGLYLQAAVDATDVLLEASIISNVSGYTKKIFYTSGIMVFYTIGNFVGPLLLRERDAPRYIIGMSVYIVANVVIICLFAYIRYGYIQANKKRNMEKNTSTIALLGDLEDISDVQNDHSIYRT